LPYSTTDKDARAITSNGKKEICYNVQATVDSKHKLILDHKVTNEINDRKQLSDMSSRAKEVLGSEKLEVLADKGYYNWDEIKECEEKGIDVYVPEVRSSGEAKRKKSGKFSSEKFKYDSSRDVYVCPGKKELSYQRRVKRLKKVMKVYTSNECKSCKLRYRCMGEVLRWEHEEVLERARRKVEDNKEKVKMRQWLAEHPFGTIKRAMNQGYMLTKGLDKVSTEFSLTVLAYNMKRVMNIVGLKNIKEPICSRLTQLFAFLSPVRKFVFDYLLWYFRRQKAYI
jgi:hypothetical protein